MDQAMKAKGPCAGRPGFALFLGILFLLILTVCGIALLFTTGSYYKSVGNLFAVESAKIACEAAMKNLVDRHNLDPGDPRFFFDPQTWQGNQLVPLNWEGYRIEGQKSQPWSSIESNRLVLSTIRGDIVARRQFGLAQRRFENFALFTDAPQEFLNSPLFDGLVHVDGEISLLQPDVRFREFVQTSGISPSWNASLRKNSLQSFDYPSVTDLLSIEFFFADAVSNGIVIDSADPVFWNGDHYKLDLSSLEIKKISNLWRITYNDIEVGKTQSLHLFFDGPLEIHQSIQTPVPYASLMVQAPLYVTSSDAIVFASSIHSIVMGDFSHPLCFNASTIRLASVLPQAARLEAVFISLGAVEIESGSTPLAKADDFKREVLGSSFLIEESKKTDLLEALEAGEKIVWFRGPVIAPAGIMMPDDLAQLHFQSSKNAYPLLPSFPFVYLVEGEEKWL